MDEEWEEKINQLAVIIQRLEKDRKQIEQINSIPCEAGRQIHLKILKELVINYQILISLLHKLKNKTLNQLDEDM